MTNATPPFATELAVKDATGYANGRIVADHKGRGFGDCRARKEWNWDGARFVATAASSSGMCRLIAPGSAWHLPTLVSKVSRPN